MQGRDLGVRSHPEAPYELTGPGQWLRVPGGGVQCGCPGGRYDLSRGRGAVLPRGACGGEMRRGPRGELTPQTASPHSFTDHCVTKSLRTQEQGRRKRVTISEGHAKAQVAQTEAAVMGTERSDGFDRTSRGTRPGE